MRIATFSDIHLIGLMPCGQCWQKLFTKGGQRFLTYSQELEIDLRVIHAKKKFDAITRKCNT